MQQAPRQTIITKINEILATRITMLVGTIWAFYALVIFGLTPVLWPGYEEQILYWSNFLQLIFLPIITVGTTIIGRDSERRARQDHHSITREFALLRRHHREVGESLQEIQQGMQALVTQDGQDNVTSLGARSGGRKA